MVDVKMIELEVFKMKREALLEIKRIEGQVPYQNMSKKLEAKIEALDEVLRLFDE